MNERGGSDDNVDCVDCLFLLESSGKAAANCSFFSFSSAGNTMRGICFEECCEYEEEEEEEMGGKRTRAKEATGGAAAAVEEAALQ